MYSAPRDAGTDEPARSDQPDEQGWGSIVLPALLRAALPIALVTLLAGYVAFTRSEGQPERYEASSQVVLSSSANFTPVDGSYGSSDRYVQNQAEIMMTLPVLDRAAAALAQSPTSPETITGADLKKVVFAEPVGASDVIAISADAGDPARAAARADAVAVAYAQFTEAEVLALADQAAAASAANPDLVLTIRARAATFGDGVSVIQPATVPSSPFAPTPMRDAYLAAGAIFLLAAGLAITWRGWRRPASPDRLAADVGAPLLGEVPVRWLGSAAMPQQPGAVHYGMALQALRYRMGGSRNHSVLLSAVGRDGSPPSALLGLAAADAAQGHRVVLVDATVDGRLLRRAGVAAPAIPLPSAVARGIGLDRALTAVPALAGEHGGSVQVARIDPASSVTEEALRASLGALQASAELVLVDAGAVRRDATAFSLLGEVGAVVAVMRGKHRSRGLQEFRRRLALAGRTADGVLLTHRTWLPALTTSPASPAPARPQPRNAPVPAGARPETAEPSAAAGRTS